MEGSGSLLKRLNNIQQAFITNRRVISSEGNQYKVGLDVVRFKGHANVRATHKTTFEITKDLELSLRGDCIIGVGADKALSDLNWSLKEVVKSKDSLIIMLIVDELEGYDVVLGSGDPRLELSDERRLIVRKSSYIDSSTLAVRATKSAADLSRKLIDSLKHGVHAKAYIIGITKS